MATLGNTNVEGSTHAANNNQVLYLATATADFTAIGMQLYIDPNSPSNQNVSVAIYTDNTGVPNTLVAQGNISTYEAGAGWKYISLGAGGSIVNGSSYWLGWWVTDSGNRMRIGSGGSRYSKTVFSGFPTWDSTWSAGTSSSAGPYSLYATDDPGPVNVSSISDSISVSESPTILITGPDRNPLQGGSDNFDNWVIGPRITTPN